MIIAAPFTIAKMCKQPVPTEGWVGKETHTHTHTHTHTYMHTHSGILSSHTKRGILPFATWMDLEGIMPTEIIYRKRDTV